MVNQAKAINSPSKIKYLCRLRDVICPRMSIITTKCPNIQTILGGREYWGIECHLSPIYFQVVLLFNLMIWVIIDECFETIKRSCETLLVFLSRGCERPRPFESSARDRCFKVRAPLTHQPSHRKTDRQRWKGHQTTDTLRNSHLSSSSDVKDNKESMTSASHHA